LYSKLFVVLQNEHRSQKDKINISIFNHTMYKIIYFIIYLSIFYLINYFVQSYNTIRLNARRLKISYNEQKNLYLHRFGLYQMTIMEYFQLDKSLLTALVERWRLEISTFYLPVDEMTMTLEDIPYLWVLPFRGNLLFLYIIFEVY
jgi:Plant mobile domain